MITRPYSETHLRSKFTPAQNRRFDAIIYVVLASLVLVLSIITSL